MAPGYRRVSAPMADPEPPPQPVPFPIRIVSDPAPQAADEDAGVTTAQGKRSDYFYESWDKFLAIEPKRAKGTSTAAKKLDEEKQDVASSDGLQVKENASVCALLGNGILGYARPSLWTKAPAYVFGSYERLLTTSDVFSYLGSRQRPSVKLRSQQSSTNVKD